MFRGLFESPRSTRRDFFKTLGSVVGADLVGKLPRETGACATDVLLTNSSSYPRWHFALMVCWLGAVIMIYSLLRRTTAPQQRLTAALRTKITAFCTYSWNLSLGVVSTCSLSLWTLGSGLVAAAADWIITSSSGYTCLWFCFIHMQ